MAPCLNWWDGNPLSKLSLWWPFWLKACHHRVPHLIGLRVPCVSHGIGFVDCRGTGSHHYGGPGPCMVGIAWRRMASRGHLLGWSQPSKSPGIHPYTGRAHSVADSASAHPRRWRPSGCPLHPSGRTGLDCGGGHPGGVDVSGGAGKAGKTTNRSTGGTHTTSGPSRGGGAGHQPAGTPAGNPARKVKNSQVLDQADEGEIPELSQTSVEEHFKALRKAKGGPVRPEAEPFPGSNIGNES